MTVKEIVDSILLLFEKTNSKPNYFIRIGLIKQSFIAELNQLGDDLIRLAIDELKNKKLINIEIKNGEKCLVLTKKGYDTIYPIDEEEAIKKIELIIFNHYKKQNANSSFTIEINWITKQLLPILNPKEQDLVEVSVSNLIDKRYVKIVHKSGKTHLVLTEFGYNKFFLL